MGKRSKLVLFLCSLWIGGASLTGVYAQSVTEARFVLQDITNWLPGIYDNDAQVFLGSAFGAGDDGIYPWLRLEIEVIENTGLGDAVFLMHSLARDEENASPVPQLLVFTVDEPMRSVRMETYQLPTGTAVSLDDGESVGAAAELLDEGCPVYRRQGPGYVYGAMQDRWCQGAGTDSGVLKRANITLRPNEVWVDRASKSADTGELQSGRMDEVPLSFNKVIDYECFIIVRHRDGSGSTNINPFFIDDGGDQFFFKTEEPSPRNMEVLLRRSLWPSRSGENFLPMLLVYLIEDGNHERPVASAWGPADGGLVGWSTGGLGSGSCKLASPASENPA